MDNLNERVKGDLRNIGLTKPLRTIGVGVSEREEELLQVALYEVYPKWKNLISMDRFSFLLGVSTDTINNLKKKWYNESKDDAR